MENKSKDFVTKYYDQEATDYIHMYEPGYLEYPANAIRLEMVTKKLLENNVKSVLDAGCGTCGPMIRFLKEGLKCNGFDFSNEMVDSGKKELEKSGYDPNLIFVADLETGENFPKEKFDAVVALGVFPHIPNEKKALLNIKNMLNEGGKVYIEFRNDLFSSYTLNKYSVDFFLNRLISMSLLPEKMKDEVVDFYTNLLKADKTIIKKQDQIHYTEILAKFKNPLTITKELFEPCGFEVNEILFYHYHVLPPIFQEKNPKLFRELSLKMEDPHDWRGYLMASAFVVEASPVN